MDVCCRTAVMKEEARKLRKNVLRSPWVDFPSKLVAVQAYLFSKGFYGAGTWPPLSCASYAKVHASVLSIYRDIAHQTFFDVDTMFVDQDIITEYNLVSPLNIIRIARLSLFARSVNIRPHGLQLSSRTLNSCACIPIVLAVQHGPFCSGLTSLSMNSVLAQSLFTEP
eukprot:12426326-Karenia_brevis.AAC.1